MNSSRSSVRWTGGAMTFELVSRHGSVLRQAATVFRPWLAHTGGTADRRWQIEPSVGSDGASAGTWRIQPEDSAQPVMEFPTSARALMAVEYEAVRELVTASGPFVSLHAAFVARDDHALAIVGRCESGKSTLACRLWQEGWSLLSDDGVLIDAASRVGFPIPRRVSVRPPSRALLGDEIWQRILSTPACDASAKGKVFHPDEVDGRTRPDSARLTGIVFLARNGSRAGPAELVKIDPVACLLSLLFFQCKRGTPGEDLQRLAPIVEGIPAYDLGRGRLDQMVDAISTLTKEPAQ